MRSTISEVLARLAQGATSLDLSGNRIGDEGTNEVAAALTTNTTLTSLRLSGNDIGAEGLREVAAALKTNTTLTSLDLSGNGIGAEGAREVAAALKTNTTLTSLDLSVRRLPLRSHLLRPHPTPSTRPHTPAPPPLRPHHLHPPITSRTADNRIGAKGAKEVAAALKTNTTLTSLNLSGNDIGAEGAKEVAAALKTNTTLTSLNLSYVEASVGDQIQGYLVRNAQATDLFAREREAEEGPRKKSRVGVEPIPEPVAASTSAAGGAAQGEAGGSQDDPTAEEAHLQAVRAELEKLRREAEVAAVQPGEQMHRCLVCFDDFPQKHGVKCATAVDAHFICADCLEGYVRVATSDGNLCRLEVEGRCQGIPCPGVGCTAPPFTERALAVQLPDAAFALLAGVRDKIAERRINQQMEATVEARVQAACGLLRPLLQPLLNWFLRLLPRGLWDHTEARQW
ncbi:hypothetical protein AB1Y20_010651 [Prymnesium parvum]|uniref:RING-type domain-containing protein n=1 Tax=Prymnesium parvum TaxID=97485 RepID=A0AB34IS14_PRYPA